MTVEVVPILGFHTLLITFCEEMLDGIFPGDCLRLGAHFLTTVVISVAIDLKLVQSSMG